MSGYCTGCGRADMAGITHVCPPLDSRNLPHPLTPDPFSGQTLPEHLHVLIGRRLERIDFAPTGVIFQFEGGIAYWATGGPPASLASSERST